MSSSLIQPNAMQSLSFSSSISATKPQWRVTSTPAVTFTRRTTKSTIKAKIREIFMPTLSSTMTEGKIVSWIKLEGDVLSKGESVVVVVESDMDVETFYDGILAAIVVPEV
ncbi:putative dihydrolipoyllysine-residue acetyltransferase [Helianthus anomalus]